MPHFKAFGMMNLQYGIRICHKIHNKGTMSLWQIQVTIFLSGTDVSNLNKEISYSRFIWTLQYFSDIIFQYFWWKNTRREGKKNKARRKLTCFTWSLAFLIQSAGEIIRPHLKHFAPKSLKYQEQIVHFLVMTFMEFLN